MKHARWPPLLCAGLHVLAMAAMVLVLRIGLTGPAGARPYALEHPTAWRLSWAVWMASALSLPLFYNWWRVRLPAAARSWDPVVIAGLGVAWDLMGETMLMLLATESQGLFPASELWGVRWSAGVANGLYTLAGIALTLRTPGLPGLVRVAMWLTWSAGIGMTVAGLIFFIPGLVISSAILFPTFIFWVSWMGLKWRRAA